jgi:hypothetical protein
MTPTQVKKHLNICDNSLQVWEIYYIQHLTEINREIYKSNSQEMYEFYFQTLFIYNILVTTIQSKKSRLNRFNSLF